MSQTIKQIGQYFQLPPVGGGIRDPANSLAGVTSDPGSGAAAPCPTGNRAGGRTANLISAMRASTPPHLYSEKQATLSSDIILS